MKIVYLHQYFNTPAMAGGTRSYEMARRLARSGHEVHLITSDRQPRRHARKWLETTEAGVRVHWTPLPYSNHMSFSARTKAFFQFAWRAARRAAALEGDVVFATSTPLTIALPAVSAARRGKSPFVFEVRDLWPELPIAVGALRNPLSIAAARALESFAYRSASHIVSLSDGMKDGIVKRGIDPGRVSVIPNSCDLELFDVPSSEGRKFRSRHQWLEGRPLVVYTGALGRINGVGYFAELAAAVAKVDPEIRFLVVGNGVEETNVRQQAEALGVLGRNFFMFGQVAKQEIPRVLSAADLATSLVIDLPETWANSANKFFDALASGTPVAINHDGWLADLIHDRGLGLVLHGSTIPEAANSLVAFLRNRSEITRAGEAARRAARELFDRDLLARRLETVLLSAAPTDNKSSNGTRRPTTGGKRVVHELEAA